MDENMLTSRINVVTPRESPISKYKIRWMVGHPATLVGHPRTAFSARIVSTSSKYGAGTYFGPYMDVVVHSKIGDCFN
jgi:hypothetical protein